MSNNQSHTQRPRKSPELLQQEIAYVAGQAVVHDAATRRKGRITEGDTSFWKPVVLAPDWAHPAYYKLPPTGDPPVAGLATGWPVRALL